VVTEKSSVMQERGTYTFEVASQANKEQVKEAVEGAFQVKVRTVNMIQVPGKRKRRGQHWYTTRSWKKAVVSLRSGDKIEIFEGA